MHRFNVPTRRGTLTESTDSLPCSSNLTCRRLEPPLSAGFEMLTKPGPVSEQGLHRHEAAPTHKQTHTHGGRQSTTNESERMCCSPPRPLATRSNKVIPAWSSLLGSMLSLVNSHINCSSLQHLQQ